MYVLEKFVESSNSRQSLEANNLLQLKQSRRLDMGQRLEESLQNKIKAIKPKGGASQNQRTAYIILRSEVHNLHFISTKTGQQMGTVQIQ